MFLAKKGMKSRKPRIEPAVAPSRPVKSTNIRQSRSLREPIGYVPPEEKLVFSNLENNNDGELQILSYLFYIFLAVIVLSNFVTSLEMVKFKGFLPSGAYLSYGITATIIAPAAFSALFLIVPAMRTVNRFMLVFATASLTILFTNVIILNYLGLFSAFKG